MNIKNTRQKQVFLGFCIFFGVMHVLHGMEKVKEEKKELNTPKITFVDIKKEKENIENYRLLLYKASEIFCKNLTVLSSQEDSDEKVEKDKKIIFINECDQSIFNLMSTLIKDLNENLPQDKQLALPHAFTGKFFEEEDIIKHSFTPQGIESIKKSYKKAIKKMLTEILDSIDPVKSMKSDLKIFWEIYGFQADSDSDKN